MKKKFLLCLIFIFFSFVINSNGIENKILLKIENQIITSIDIKNEYKYLVALNPSLKNSKKKMLLNFQKNQFYKKKLKKLKLKKILTTQKYHKNF